MQTYISAVSWISRGFARHIPKQQQIQQEHINELKQQIEQEEQDGFDKINFTNMVIEEDNYPLAVDDLSSDQLDNYQIKNTDALILAAKIQKQFSSVEVYIYQQQKNNIFVHHQIQLSSFPLSMSWLGNANGGKKCNLAIVSSFLPQIEIWDLDVVNAVEPLVVLGGEEVKKKELKKKKKFPKKFKEGSHIEAVLTLDINKKNQNILCSGSADNTIKFWDLNVNKCLHTSHLHSQRVEVVRWHQTQKQIVISIGADGLGNLIDSRSPSVSNKFKLSGEIQDAQWNLTHTNQVIMACQDGRIIVKDMKMPQKNLYQLKGHQKAATSISFSMNNICASSGFDGLVHIWDLNNGKLLTSQNPKCGKLYSMQFYQDCRSILAVGNQQGELYVWDLQENQILAERLKTF